MTEEKRAWIPDQVRMTEEKRAWIPDQIRMTGEKRAWIPDQILMTEEKRAWIPDQVRMTGPYGYCENAHSLSISYEWHAYSRHRRMETVR